MVSQNELEISSKLFCWLTISNFLYIIVLLILAAVSLGAVFSSDGLFGKANLAATLWNDAKEEESDILNQISNEMDRYIKEDSEDGKKLVEMFKKAQEDNCIDGTTCKKTKEHVHIGDYITNYNETLKNPLSEATISAEESGISETKYIVDTSTTWKVAGLSKDGTQLIITSGSVIKNANEDLNYNERYTLALRSAEGWYHTNDNILDRVCKIYDSNYTSRIASMRIEDVETLLGLSVEINGKNTKAYKTENGIKKELTAEDGFEHYYGEKYTYIDGDTAPENYLKEKYPTNSKYANLPTRKTGDIIDLKGHSFEILDSNVVDKASKIYNILFNSGDNNNIDSVFWLPSSGIEGSVEYGAYYGPGTVDNGEMEEITPSISNNMGLYSVRYGEPVFEFGARPVVYLNPNVTSSELKVSPSLK